jgi:hypothetical protein|tara:strand:- start:742 stop:1278 length:537 start_codon:yes stop_codon:yes gene_type:complete
MKEKKMMTKMSPIYTNTLDVQWSHLHKPDDKFGSPGNHNITVVVNEDLQTTLDKTLKDSGAKKINGMREADGVTTIKVKSTIYTKDGTNTFPCKDASTNDTDAVPFGGDKVRLRLSPMVISRDNSLSFFLNGCQIIEKNEKANSGGFTATDGFDGSDYKAPVVEQQEVPEVTDDNIPF